MSADRLNLTSLIEAVADGVPLDAQIDDPSLKPEERRLVQHLRLVAAVADVHRTLARDTVDAGRRASVGLHQPGQRWGNLELIEKIGEGAFGEVWRTRDVLLESEVALKLIHPRFGPDDVMPRVLQEGRALARLRHVNVVTVHGVEEHGGELGLRMEFIRGKTLEQLLRATGPYGAREAALIGQDLCRALATVHRAGLVHRDLKSQNVMREDGGRLVLMDLGSGRLLSETHGHGLAGTPLCLAPEVLNGGEATVQSDLYSLGVLLYHLVTDDYPVHAGSLEELRSAHASGRVVWLHDLRPDLPEGFVRTVERALAKRPEDRFASAGEMGTALAAGLATPVDKPVRDSRSLASTVGAWLREPRGLVLAGMAVVAVALAVVWGYSAWRSSRAAPPTAVRRIAVLPFTTIDQDPQLDYLAHGIPMELTASLGQIGALRVVPWSFMKRVGPTEGIREVSEKAGADAIVEGTIQRVPNAAADTIRLRVQIYQAGTGTLLWTQSFEHPVAGLLQLQADIARQIAARFEVLLARREEMLLSRFQAVPAEAVEVYLKGRQAWEDYRDNFKPAIDYFGRAVAIHPQFADAYAGLADCYTLQASFSGTASAPEAFARALGAANHAIALNPELPEAYATRGYAKALLAWDWSGADADYRRALELDPESAAVRTSYSDYLSMVGRHEDAIEQSRLAEDRAPLSSVVARRLGWAFYMGRRYDEAIVQLHNVLAVEPTYSPARTLLARAYAMAGRYDEAVQQVEPVEKGFEAIAAQVYAQAGRRDQAHRLLAIATAPNAEGNPRYQIAAAYASLGDIDTAMLYLERAFAEHDPGLVNIAYDPRLDNLRGDPRFQSVMARMNLTRG